MPRTSSKKVENNKERKNNSKHENENSVNATNGSISEEENESSKGSEITRCVCGIEDNDDDSSDGGLYIQCDQCSVWQHGHCVGFQEESDVPDVYYCELCRPELHKLYQRGRGPKQSKYMGLVGEQKPQQSESSDASPPSPVVRRQIPKQRLTMNSRDAALDYEEYLTIAKEQSLLNRRSRGLSKSASPVQASVSEEALPVKETPKEQEPGLEQEQGHGPEEEEEEEDQEQEQNQEQEQEQGRGHGRGQEEKRKEQEETSREEGQEPEPGKIYKDESIPINTITTEEKVEEEKNLESEPVKEEPESTLPSPTSVQSTQASSTAGRGGGRKSKREAPVDHEKGSLSPSITGQRGPKNRKTGSRKGKSSGFSANGHRSAPNHAEGEQTTEASTKQKGLHPRITITEMRRRVATMLEYIGHIQVEMASQSANAIAVSQMTKEISEDEKETLRQVDNLTRELLHWEQRFGKT
ncbi:histone deacetylase complex PHD finger subunit Cti6 [Schizosaccharomyces osmophilus]|uniref:Histone deacetylase complex PHD finger subunit Cti6 n=1 Tax=Schizosaccharomyces osmophilus TaxID=2545709 RepID=A0AAE9WBS2_9SCHI|nr:histone deacetylase complex PHD finger subunit Cti6 [Schizosaccharomyces osmophilus]WBW72546.1 histone deacetylase complex PHD finger subunit Cti6 [Schizosaccharomyces osmophilus]